VKIADILNTGKRTLSFEVFPPKTSDKFDTVREATEKIAALRPSYMSVTFGAGGNGARYTLPIAANIEQKFEVPVVHHLTCVGSTFENIDERLIFMRMVGVENVLALRGDMPDGAAPEAWDFHHADELAKHIKAKGDFCIGGAAYPEKHPEAPSLEDDIRVLRLKEEAGCEYFTTQLFFDNNLFYDFLEKVRAAGVTVPIVAGIMPVTSVKQISRIFGLSHSKSSPELDAAIEKYELDPDSFRKAGIDFAKKQIADIYAHGIRNVHLYTMNNAELAADIKNTFGSED